MICWVTGAGGQVGSELCLQLTNQGHHVIGIGRGPAPALFPGQWIKWNIGIERRPNVVIHAPDWIFHLAGQTSAYRARDDLTTDITVNVLGFSEVLLASLEAGSHPFVVIAGAATEVGMLDKLTIDDTAVDNPQTFYDVGKTVQGLYLHQFAREGWLHGCKLRFANVYGGLSSNESDRGFLNNSVTRALSGKPLTYFPDGTYTRDFLFVEDAASSLIAASTNQHFASEQSFMIGTGRGTTIRQALTRISEIVYEFTGILAPVVSIDPSEDLYAIERRDAVIDASGFQQGTGWAPVTSLEAGITKMVQRAISGSQ
jgi:nucleoside-diphosphate-sugar epimerase